MTQRLNQPRCHALPPCPLVYGHQAYKSYGTPKIRGFVKTTKYGSCAGTGEDAVDHGKLTVLMGSGIETPETGAQCGVEQLGHSGEVGRLKRTQDNWAHATPFCLPVSTLAMLARSRVCCRRVCPRVAPELARKTRRPDRAARDTDDDFRAEGYPYDQKD
ncbi:MAG: hypothetical protein M1274_11235 [Actinobacteria bacterium]|nr:hypothetical protein [Actinomycetota bacterium]